MYGMDQHLGEEAMINGELALLRPYPFWYWLDISMRVCAAVWLFTIIFREWRKGIL